MTGQAASERLVKQPVAPLGSELSVCPLCSRGALWRGGLTAHLPQCLSLTLSEPGAQESTHPAPRPLLGTLLPCREAPPLAKPDLGSFSGLGPGTRR